MKRFVLLSLLLASCGGSSSPSTPSTPAPSAVSVGGNYTMAVALTENGCGAVNVQPLPTRIDHGAGAATFQLTHGATYSCALSGRSFTCQPQAFVIDGRTETVTVDGTFRSDGFDATARVAVSTGCAYAVRWTGTKQGTPNILP